MGDHRSRKQDDHRAGQIAAVLEAEPAELLNLSAKSRKTAE